MDSTRIWHGVLLGMAATVLAGIVPIWALALSLWPVQEPVTATAFAQLLQIAPSSTGARLLAAVWQLIYGGFWGAFLAYVSGPIAPALVARPSTLSYGLGVGLFRWLVGGIAVMLPLGWGPFALLVAPSIALWSLAADLLFGLTTGWLLAREDLGRLYIPGVRPRRLAR